MQSRNITHILWIGGSTIFTGLINYLYHPLILRYMSVSDFGVFASLLSVTNLLSIAIMGISFFLTKEMSRMIAEKDRVYGLYRSSLASLSLIGVGLMLFYILISPLIERALHIESWGLILLTGVTLLLSALSVAYSALFRSMKTFRFLSISQGIAPIVKLVIGFVLVYLGYRVGGALIGLLLSGAIMAVASLVYAERIFRSVEPRVSEDFFALIQREQRGVLRYILGTVLFTFFMNADILFAKHIYSPHDAGIYAGVSVLAKFLIFFLLSIETVYYGQIMEYTRKTLPKRLIREPLLIILVTSIVSLLGGYFLAGYVLEFLKAELRGQEGVFLFLIVYSALLAVVSLVSKVLVGWGESGVTRILGVGAIVTIISVMQIEATDSTFYFLLALSLPLAIVVILLLALLFSRWHPRKHSG